MAYFVEKMAVDDFIAALEKTKTVIIPVGVVEQHGYHLPLSTDILNAEKPLELAGDRLNAVVAPTVKYCFSGGDLPGTVNVNPNVFGMYVTDICLEYAKMGFKNIILFLGHAGTENQGSLYSSIQMMIRRDEQFKDKTVSLVKAWELSETWLSCFAMTPEHDFHAGLIETSLMMYWAPELVKDKITMDTEELSRNMRSDQDWFEKREKKVDHEFVVPRVTQKEEIKIGVMGFPERATIEIGEKTANEIVDGLCKYVDFLEKNN